VLEYVGERFSRPAGFIEEISHMFTAPTNGDTASRASTVGGLAGVARVSSNVAFERVTCECGTKIEIGTNGRGALYEIEASGKDHKCDRLKMRLSSGHGAKPILADAL
jgi:hypothetical protein